VLGILRPYPEYPLDPEELTNAWRTLTDGSTPFPQLSDYTVVVGEVGRKPSLIEARSRPFRVRTRIGAADFDIRMESWLPTDTIRRAGFGQVVVDRRHVLTLDRGVSFAALGAVGEPAMVLYRSGLFAPLRRLIPWYCPGPGPCRP
jgi:hypothetical protein